MSFSEEEEDAAQVRRIMLARKVLGARHNDAKTGLAKLLSQSTPPHSLFPSPGGSVAGVPLQETQNGGTSGGGLSGAASTPPRPTKVNLALLAKVCSWSLCSQCLPMV